MGFNIQTKTPPELGGVFCGLIAPSVALRRREVLFQLADFYITIPAIVLVVGEHDMADDFFAKAGLFSELALGETSFDGLATEIVGQYVFTVEPVFDVVAFDYNAGGVPFTDGF